MEYRLGELIQGVSQEDYSKGMGPNELRSGYFGPLSKCPAILLEHINNPPETTVAMNRGSILHCAVLEAEKYMDLRVLIPDFVGPTKDGRPSSRSADAKKQKEEWFARQRKDAIFVTKEHDDMVIGISKRFSEHKLISRLMKNGIRESSLWVKDSEHDITSKIRPDFISEKGHLCDLKTTRDASHSFFTQQIFSGRNGSPQYIVQAAHYVHCAKLSKILNDDAFYIIAVETVPPFCANVFALDSHCLEIGERIRARLTKLFAECVKTNTWPGYPEMALPVAIPSWVAWENEE